MPVRENNWDGYSYIFGDGLVARIHFDVQAAQETQHFGYDICVRVIVHIPVDQVVATGQPTSQALERLLQEQSRLIEILEKESFKCRFVGMMLYAAMSDMVFQVEPDELQRMDASISGWAKSLADFRIETTRSPGWNFFDSKVRPSIQHAQQISDREVIKALLAAGSNPDKTHRLKHTFLGPEKVLRALAKDLKKWGLKDPVFPDKEVLQMTTASTLNIMAISQLTGQLARYCADHGLVYDGWGAEIVG